MLQSRRIYCLNQNFRWKSSVKLKEEFLLPEKIPSTSRSSVSQPAVSKANTSNITGKCLSEAIILALINPKCQNNKTICCIQNVLNLQFSPTY